MLYRKVKDEDGTEHQKSEGFDTQKEAEARKKRLNIRNQSDNLRYLSVQQKKICRKNI